MLLHEMGKGLAENPPEANTTGREWRTPPLWGGNASCKWSHLFICTMVVQGAC